MGDGREYGGRGNVEVENECGKGDEMVEDLDERRMVGDGKVAVEMERRRDGMEVVGEKWSSPGEMDR